MTEGNANPFTNVMKQVQEAQENIKKLQLELENQEVIGEAGAGLVKITGTGSGQVKNIMIDESVYQEKKEILEGLLVAAMNDFKLKRQQTKDEKLKGMFAGFPLPPGMNFPFMS